MAKSGIFDLEKHFAFYGAYHSNRINIFIHMVFVWPIFFTSLVLLYFTPSLFNCAKSVTCPCGNSCVLGLNFGFFLTLIYAVFYVLMDKKAGSLAALACFFCWVGSSFLASKLGFSLAWKFVLAGQVVCWTGQFIGHGVFEALQKVAGYEPYPGFIRSVTAKIEEERKAWQDKKDKKVS
ncbi:2-hydroxy-palmitic acid dioxygenase Mpo1-like [Dillenia turbinata]|uniref:2-hydroxy-palmitic acid dioxygenase Mpo1-like n=1 Tax=Dillenia turbinata TaxID=194707 RepID=A0AAN8Z3G2_9MAGN